MNALQLLRTTFEEWRDDNASRLAAALAYYTVFSLAPLLIIIIAVAGLVIGQQQARGEVVAQIEGFVGSQSAELINTMLTNTNQQSSNIIATVVGLVTLLLGATGVFGELQGSLNQIWDVKPRPQTTQQGIRSLLISRVLSLGMVLVIGFLLLVSLVITTTLAALSSWVLGETSRTAFFGQALNFIVSFAVTTLLFALIYKVLPDIKIAWRDVLVGAAFTALLFSLGRLLISFYLTRSSVTSVYGAAGSLVVLLLWVFYSAQIVFFGAEFTQVYTRLRGERQGEAHLLKTDGATDPDEKGKVEPELPGIDVPRQSSTRSGSLALTLATTNGAGASQTQRDASQDSFDPPAKTSVLPGLAVMAGLALARVFKSKSAVKHED